METFRKVTPVLALMAMLFLWVGLPPVMAPTPTEDIASIIPEHIEKAIDSESKPSMVRESKEPREDVPVPDNAIATPNGGYVTIPQTKNAQGETLDINYVIGEKGSGGKYAPVCRGPDQGLYQEGGDWDTTFDSNTIGYYEEWTMPTGSLSGTSVGIYYNPVNFRYPATQGEYDYFQVDFGIGNNLDDREDWIMTYSYEDDNGVRQYPFTQLSSVPISPGNEYEVSAMLQPYPLANPSSYVVQISLGSSSWLVSEPLGYTPSLGDVNDFHTFQDQWLVTSGSSTLSADLNDNPAVILEDNGSIDYDSTLVTDYDLWEDLNPGFAGDTWDILTPMAVTGDSFEDERECSSWS